MVLKLFFFLIAYFFTSILNDACAITTESEVVSVLPPIENRRIKIEPGSLEEIALKDGWQLELIDKARQVDNLTNREKDVILAINMVRSDPRKYAELYVKPIISSYNGKLRVLSGVLLRTAEGRVAAEELYEFLIHHEPLAPLDYAHELHLSADELALDQSLTGKNGHINSQGRNYNVRIRSYGRWKPAIAETICYGGKTGFDMVNTLLIDDGATRRGDRLIIMDPGYHLAGVSVRNHSGYGLIAVIDYADAFSAGINTPK